MNFDEEEDDDDDDAGDGQPTKKRRGGQGRRKIEIEYIEDKIRRHITFSKRKAGISKKAYELSRLTGAQVLLLISSERGQIYSFATPKLQPILINEQSKALIEQCLNAPDPAAYGSMPTMMPGAPLPPGAPVPPPGAPIPPGAPVPHLAPPHAVHPAHPGVPAVHPAAYRGHPQVPVPPGAYAAPHHPAMMMQAVPPPMDPTGMAAMAQAASAMHPGYIVTHPEQQLMHQPPPPPQ